MRYIFGTLALLAAIVIVGYSATTLFASAYYSASEPWQQWLNGAGAAAIVVWEATAVLLIGSCWHRGYKPVAVLATFGLVAAMAASLGWEMRAVVGGQADKLASREVDASQLQGITEDLKWMRQRRDKLTSRKDLEWVEQRIQELELKRSKVHAVKDVLPQAALSARMTGWSEETWRDIWVAIPLVFWMIARIVAMPLAVAGMSSVARKPQEASVTGQARGTIIVASQPVPAPTPSPELLESFLSPIEVNPEPEMVPEPPKPPRKEPEPVVPVQEHYPPKPIDKDPRFSEAKKKSSNFPKSIAAFRKQYLKDAPGRNSDGSPRNAVKGKILWDFYSALPGDSEVKSQSGFGKKLAKLGVKRENRVDGVWYTEVMLVKEIQEAVA